jgi:hypothetical protein
MKEPQSPAPQSAAVMPPTSLSLGSRTYAQPSTQPSPPTSAQTSTKTSAQAGAKTSAKTDTKSSAKMGAKTGAKTGVKTMAKTMANNVAIVPMASSNPVPSPGEPNAVTTPTGAQNPSQSGTGRSAQTAPSRASKTGQPKVPKPPVSFRQVWAAQQQKKHLQVQVEQFNQQHAPPTEAKTDRPPNPYSNPNQRFGPDVLSAASPVTPPLAAPLASEDAKAAWENAQALRTLSGRNAARTQTLSPVAESAAFGSGGAPKPIVPPLTPGRIRRRPRTLKSWLRASLRWGIGLLHQGRQRLHGLQSALGPNQLWWDAAFWVGGAFLLRWGSQILPGLAPMLTGGMVLGTIAAMYLAWQSQNGSAILYRLFLLLLGFWLGGRL